MTKIRSGHTEELEVLTGIVRDATRHLDEQGIPHWDSIYPNRLILKDDIERQQMYVLEVEGWLAGLIVMNEDPSPEDAGVAWKYLGRALMIRRLTIHPTFQGRGLATRLMDFADYH